MHIFAFGSPKKSVGLTKFGFWVIRILNISDGYPITFQYDAFLACLSIFSNTCLPRLNFFLHTYLEEQGGEALRYSCAVGSRKPIAHSNLVQDRVVRGEIKVEDLKLVYPRLDLFSNYNRDY